MQQFHFRVANNSCNLFTSKFYDELITVVLSIQLICVIYFDVNTYGSLFAYPVGFILRLGGGEPLLGLAPFINYPGNNHPESSNFPFKTFAMLVTLAIILIVSYITKYLFQNEILPPAADVLQCKLTEGGRTNSLKEKRVCEKLMEADSLWFVQESRQLFEKKSVSKLGFIVVQIQVNT